MSAQALLQNKIDEANTLYADPTSANWVAWDNVSLKYFGTAEGDIVEGDPEALSLNQMKTSHLQWDACPGVFPINGIQQERVQRGLNIVRRNDGSVRKLLNQ